MSNFIKLNKSFLDLNKYTNYTYIEVLLSLNIRIPHLCYHNQLPVSGNCRLCLGVIGADRKPAPLCATSVRPNDIVDYNSARVRRLRQDVLEFLLLNHPMDCPSCDQGGECDLQDYSYNYGTDRSRHTFSYKKAILNKDRGALIKTVMNRCINCTRCTRFFAEVVGSSLVGIIGRGINSEISSYVETKFADCEFSGNVIDLCPVGALTSHANAFAYRPWNLKRYNSIDILDSLGSNLTFHLAGSTIVKITPRINYDLNLNWISDKARYMFDGLNKQRILTPLYRTTSGNFISLTWKEALNTLVRDLNITKQIINLGCYFGDLLNNETIFIASKFMDIIGNPNKYSIQDNLYINNDFVSNFIFNSKVTSLSNKTDMCFIFGSNLKSELPLVNLRLRKQYLATALSIITFGVRTNLMYPTYFFGFKMKTLIKFFEGTNNFCKYLFTKKYPTFLINLNIFKNETIYNIFNIFKQNIIKTCSNITATNFNYIYPNMDLYNKLFLNIQSKYKTSLTNLDCLYLLNVDKNFVNLTNNLKLNNNCYTICQSHHYNQFMNTARMVLPAKPYVQEEGSFINLQGDILRINDIIYDDNLAVKDNILILYSIFSTLFPTLKDSFKKIISNNEILMYNPVLNNKFINDNIVLSNTIKLKNNIVKNYTLNSTLYKFYANDNISLASSLMSNCNKTLVKRSNY